MDGELLRLVGRHVPVPSVADQRTARQAGPSRTAVTHAAPTRHALHITVWPRSARYAASAPWGGLVSTITGRPSDRNGGISELRGEHVDQARPEVDRCSGG